MKFSCEKDYSFWEPFLNLANPSVDYQPFLKAMHNLNNSLLRSSHLIAAAIHSGGDNGRNESMQQVVLHFLEHFTWFNQSEAYWQNENIQEDIFPFRKKLIGSPSHASQYTLRPMSSNSIFKEKHKYETLESLGMLFNHSDLDKLQVEFHDLDRYTPYQVSVRYNLRTFFSIYMYSSVFVFMESYTCNNMQMQ